MDAKLRILGPEDAAEFVRLRRLALELEPHAFAERPDTDPSCDVAWVRARLAESDGDHGAFMLGAFEPALVGMLGIAAGPGARTARLWGFFVHGDCRHRGVGTRLLAEALRRLLARRVAVDVELSVSSASRTAIALYERAGFTTRGRPGKMRRRMTLRVGR